MGKEKLLKVTNVNLNLNYVARIMTFYLYDISNLFYVGKEVRI